MNSQPVLLIIGYVWPEPNSSAAGKRMVQLISVFRKLNYKITFASPAADSLFSVDLNSLNVCKANILLNDESFDAFILNLKPDVVLFDRFMMEEQFGWRVAEHCPEAVRILDTEDLHSLRNARQMAWKEGREDVDLFSDMAKREIASILRCDCSLIISEFEMQLLIKTYKINPEILFYYPILFDPISNYQIENLPSFEDRKDFVFIGNFLHEPNWAAVKYLKEVIWPELHKSMKGVSLKIYGAYPSQKVLQLHAPKQGFEIIGRAEDSKKVMQEARVCLAPMLFGAGLKGKLLDAMVCGTPSVTSTIGAEGIRGYLEWSGNICDDPFEFSQAAIDLYKDKNKWMLAQKNGIQIINHRFLKSDFEPVFTEKLHFMESSLKSHRESNFMGAILMHHTLASTKYMSKWIEAKSLNPFANDPSLQAGDLEPPVAP